MNKNAILSCLLGLSVMTGVPMLASSAQSAETIPYKEELTSTKGHAKVTTSIEAQIPTNPKRVVAIDYITPDLLASWGILDKVVAMPHAKTLPHLAEEMGKIPSAGGMKDFDAKAIAALKPDLITISARLGSKYAEISRIAPTIINAVEYNMDPFESFKEVGMRNAKIYGMEAKFAEQLAPIEKRVAAIKEKSKGKTMLGIIIVRDEAIVLGNNSRASMIPVSFGFTNVGLKEKTGRSTAKTLEAIKKLDPDYIFVLSKDLGTGMKDARPAAEVLKSDILSNSKAFKNGNVGYLNPGIWYLAEGGVEAMDIMLTDVEKVLNK